MDTENRTEVRHGHHNHLRHKGKFMVDKLGEKRDKEHDEHRIGHLKRYALKPQRAFLPDGYVARFFFGSEIKTEGLRFKKSHA